MARICPSYGPAPRRLGRFLPRIRALGARSVADIGAGAGLPGIVLAILDTDLEVTLVESREVAVAFLAETIRALGLESPAAADPRRQRVRVALGRAETLGGSGDHREAYDVAVSRALAKSPVAAELMLPFVKVGGAALLAKGPDPAAEIAAAAYAIATLGGGTPRIEPYTLPGRVSPFHIVVLPKERPTPPA